MIHREAWYREAARLVEAEKGLFWHGTSTVFLREILKQGLIPDPPHRSYGEPPEDRKDSYSIETFGGAYLSANWMTAYSHAGNAYRKFGGNRLMVGVRLETRSPDVVLDEDDFRGPLTSALKMGDHYSTLTDPVSFWGQVLRDADLLRWGIQNSLPPENVDRAAEVIRSTPLEEPLTRLIRHLGMKVDSAERYRLEQNERFRGECEAALRSLSLLYLYSLYPEAGDQRGAFEDYKAAVDRLSRSLRKAIYEIYGQSTLRSMAPIGYSGSNRIVLVVEIQGGLGEPAQLKVIYKTDEDAMRRFLDQYRSHIGPSYEVAA